MNDFDNKQICSYKDIDRFGFTCDVCGRETNGCNIVNGMKFCAKCYQETFGKDNQQNEIQQLKQQLADKQNTIDEINKEFVQAVHDWKALCAEKDKEIAHLKEMDNYRLRYELAGADETIANLRQQLEEKDKEIERLKVFEKAYYFNQNQVSQESMDLLLQNAYQVHNETQLAIQELEKVNAMLVSKAREVVGTGVVAVRLYTINEVIDQQIKELKGK